MRMRMLFWTALLGALAGGSAADSTERTGNAPALLASLRAAVHDAHTNKDAVTYLQSAIALHTFLNGSPRATLQLAAAQAYAGKTDAALASIQQYIAMGQSDPDAFKGEQFAPLAADKRFQALLASMNLNDVARGRTERVCAFKFAEWVPEDIDYDAAGQRFFVTSVLRKDLTVMKDDCVARRFAKSPDGWPMMAVKLDPLRNRVWVTEMDLAAGRSALLAFALDTGALTKRIAGPPRALLGDMVLDADGNPVVSDGQGGGIYRASIEAKALSRIDGGDFISPQTPALLPDGRLMVPDYLRGIAVLDPASRKVSWLGSQGRYALAGIDGLYLFQHALIATENGSSPERVVRFDLDPKLDTIVAEGLIERATKTLGDPTHGVVVEGYFYYLANSGWEALDDHAHRKPNSKMEPALLMRARLN